MEMMGLLIVLNETLTPVYLPSLQTFCSISTSGELFGPDPAAYLSRTYSMIARFVQSVTDPVDAGRLPVSWGGW